MALLESSKLPADVQVYRVDFSAWLTANADDGYSFDVTSDPGIGLSVGPLTSGVAGVWVSGGQGGNSYKVSVTLRSTGGRSKQADILVRVEQPFGSDGSATPTPPAPSGAYASLTSRPLTLSRGQLGAPARVCALLAPPAVRVSGGAVQPAAVGGGDVTIGLVSGAVTISAGTFGQARSAGVAAPAQITAYRGSVGAQIDSAITNAAQVAAAMTGADGYFFDGNDFTSISTASGALVGMGYTAAVTGVADRSNEGTALSVVAASGGGLPSYGANGKRGLGFGGPALRSNNGGGSTGITLILAINMPTGGWQPTLWTDTATTGAGYKLRFDEPSSSIVFQAGAASVSYPFQKGVSPVVITAWHDGAQIGLRINKDNPVTAACGTIPSALARTTLAAEDNQSSVDYSQYFEVVYAKNAALAQRDKIASYFASLIGAPDAAPIPPPPSVTVVTVPALAAQTQTHVSSTSTNSAPQDLDSPIVGEYRVSSNIWAPPAVYSQTTQADMQANGVKRMQIDWNFPGTNSSVKNFPNICFGQQAAESVTTTPRMPALLSKITKLVTQGASLTTLASGNNQFNSMYDAGYDIFFSAGTPAPATNHYGAEMMILQQWIINGLGGNAPDFTYNKPGGGTAAYMVRVLTINNWPYVAFYARQQTNDIGLDLMQFINYAFAQGYYSGAFSGVAAASPALAYPFTATGPYIDMVEVGIEVEYGQGSTVLNDFAVTLETTP